MGLPDTLKPRISGDPVLHRVAGVVPAGQNLVSLFENMEASMFSSRGIGIAAPQIGVPLRAFAAVLDGVLTRVVNPVLTYNGETDTEIWEEDVEGCLSIPGESFIVKRQLRLHLSGFSALWEPISMDLNGYAARIVQHEYDHLEGLLISDRGKPSSDRLPHRFGGSSGR